MVARAYHDLGAVNGETVGSRMPYSTRGHDKDQNQNFVFECEPTDPFTGIVHIQISQDEPPTSGDGSELTWADLASLDFDDEGGTIFVQFEVEAAMVRRIVKVGNYTSGRINAIKTMR